MPKAKPKKRMNVGLTSAQVEIAGQFGDYSLENPKMTFEEVVLEKFGPDLFPATAQGRLFEKVCREVLTHGN
jgi:hypothetical protein